MNANNAIKEILPFHHLTQEGEIKCGEECACCGQKDTSKCQHCGQHLPESAGDKDTNSESESSEESGNDSESAEESPNKRYKWIRCSNGTYRAKCTACKKNESMNVRNVTPPSKRKTSQKATKTQAPKKLRRNLPPMKNLNESEKNEVTCRTVEPDH